MAKSYLQPGLPLLAIALAALVAGPSFGADLGIRGSYELVKRVLPDGTEVLPPDVVGFMTYTRKMRNTNVMWKGEGGKVTSLSYLAKYKVTLREYCETPVYWMQNNLGEDGVGYEWPPSKAECTKVTTVGGHPKFMLNGEPVDLQFSAKGFTATAKGQFVDHWKKVY